MSEGPVLLPADVLKEKFDNAANYVVIALILVTSLCIGLFFWWRGHKTTDDYLLGGRSASCFPITLSLVTSFNSGVTLLGIPSWMYLFGTQYATVVVSYVLQAWITITFFMPVFVRLPLVTVYEYLELRFQSKLLRSLTSLFFLLVILMYLSVAVLAPSVALAQVTTLDENVSCGVIFGVCGIYTCLGGLKAVLWTDVLQFFVMLGSYLALVCYGTYVVGGSVFKTNYDHGRIMFWNFDPDPRAIFTVWTTVIGNTFMALHVFAVCQSSVQRYWACKSEAVARRALIWTCVGMASILFSCVYLGLLIFAYYVNCDPIGKQVERPDQLVALFVMQVMGDFPGFAGLFVAGLLSGTLSTVSTGLNSLASILLQDAFMSFGWIKRGLHPRREVIITRAMAVSFCIASYLFSFVVKADKNVMDSAIRLLGLIAGPVLGVFTLGMFLPFANRKGALSGFFVATFLGCWMFFGQTLAKAYKTSEPGQLPLKTNSSGCPTNWTPMMKTTTTPSSFPHLALYDVSSFWHPVLTWWCVMLIGSIVSLLEPQDPETLLPGLITPNVSMLFKWWPSRMRKPVEDYYARVPQGPPERVEDPSSDLKNLNEPKVKSEEAGASPVAVVVPSPL